MLERLSWKRLALELFLCCIPALILGAFSVICRGFTGGGDRIAYLAFLEFVTSVVVAVGRSQYDAAAGKRQLGTAAVWSASNADA